MVDKEPKAMIKIEYYGKSEDGGERHTISVEGHANDLIKAYIGITKTMEEKVGIPKSLIKLIVKIALEGTYSKDVK